MTEDNNPLDQLLDDIDSVAGVASVALAENFGKGIMDLLSTEYAIVKRTHMQEYEMDAHSAHQNRRTLADIKGIMHTLPPVGEDDEDGNKYRKIYELLAGKDLV